MKSDPIARALTLPNGAAFYRCALQVNPHHYVENFRGQPNPLEENEYVEAIVSACVKLHIRVIGLTDHNSVASVELFRSVAEKAGVTVFPGFELTSSEGVHVLCLYPPEIASELLNRYLGGFGVHNLNASSELSSCGFSEILERLQKQGGVSIAAHVTQNSGLLSMLSGRPRVQVWKDPNLFAVQIPGAIDEAPSELVPILRNKDPEYRRDVPPCEDLAIAIVNAADVAKPEDLEKPGASCWIKMSEISIEGLRQAFLDPASRIRLASDGDWGRHPELTAVAWEGGFLDGGAIHFNENLNVLVGGRGTGKSTVIESIRYVLGLEPLGDDARKQHEGFVRNVLLTGTKISLCIRSHSPAFREYLIERTVPNPSIVRDREGNLINLRPSDVLPGVEVYGQHEISELTKSPEKLTRLLDRFAIRDPGLPQRKIELLHQMEKSRTRILEASKELKQLEDRLAGLPGIEETLAKFQQAGVGDRLKERSQMVGEERVLKTVRERIHPIQRALTELERAAEIDMVFLSEKALAGLPSKGLLRELEPVLERLQSAVREAVAAISNAQRVTEDSTAAIEAQWMARKQEAQAQFEKTLRDLQRSQIDGHEFIRLREQAEELRPLTSRRENLTRTLREFKTERRSLAAEWEELKRQEFQSLDKASKKVKKALEGRVRVRVKAGGHRDPLERLLREQIGGRLSEAIEALNKVPDLSLTELVEKCREGAAAVTARFGIPPIQSERLSQSKDDVLMQFEELDLAAVTSIELNVAGEGQSEEWRSLDALSTGQKATAVLLLLLLKSDAPLIVDQPEDDLDNRFITEGIVPKMRKEKRQRQFVFATHNANIPVLGDAELIIGISTAFDGSDVRGALLAEEMGSIDMPRVRRTVEEVLEGGRDAFETRRRKYRF